MFLPGRESLLKAPILNQKQAEVLDALGKTVDLNEITYKYPKSGETPFVFYDLDGDGLDEALVFYAFKSESTEVRAKILHQVQPGEWETLYDISGQGDGVDFVEFASMKSRDRINIIIGWGAGGREKNLDIISIVDGQYRSDYSSSYYNYSLVDYGGNALNQILIITRESRNMPFKMQLLGGKNGKIVPLDEAVLYYETAEILAMQIGQTYKRDFAVFVDGVHENGTVSTAVYKVEVESSRFELVAGGNQESDDIYWKNFTSSFRPDRTISADIDKDGIMELPVKMPLSGFEEGDEIIPLMLTEFRVLGEEGYTPKYHAVINERDGYLVFFPENWRNKVTIEELPENNEWRFYELVDATGTHGEEILRIFAHFKNDSDTLLTEEYVKIASTHTKDFYAYFPNVTNSGLGVAEDELRRMFMLV